MTRWLLLAGASLCAVLWGLAEFLRGKPESDW